MARRRNRRCRRRRRHHRRALAAFADEGHDFSDHRIVGKLRAGALQAFGEGILAEEQHLIGIADAVQVGPAELAPLQPDHVEPDQDRLRPERKSERNDVAGDPAHAAQHRALADADELVHGGVAADEHVVGDRDVTAEHRAVGERDVVADVAVMTDMRIGHQEAAIADRGDAAVVLGAGADRHAFADLAVPADRQPRGAAAVSGRLRRACRARRTDRSRCCSPIAVTPARLTCDNSRTPACNSTRGPIVQNGPTSTSSAKLAPSATRDEGSIRGNVQPSTAIMAPSSASATTSPPTLASPRNHHMFLRRLIRFM